MHKIWTSCLPYVGGKLWAVPELLNMIPDGTREIISPFGGGLCFEINCAVRRYKVQAYDIQLPVVNFWKQYLQNPVHLEKRAKDFVKAHTREQHIDLKKQRVMEHDSLPFPFFNEFTNAYRFYAQTHLGFGNQWHGTYVKKLKIVNDIIMYDKKDDKGADDRSNMHYLFPTDNGGTKGDCHNRLDLSVYLNLPLSVDVMDFRESIPRAPADAFLYADPPYMESEGLYKVKEFDHEALREMLGARDKWVLSYNNCDAVKRLYDGFRMMERERLLGLRNKNKDLSELLIVSDDIEMPMSQGELF